jgi:hypothetical protein
VPVSALRPRGNYVVRFDLSRLDKPLALGDALLRLRGANEKISVA